MNENLRTSQAGLEFICLREGFKPMPYNDSCGYATIGYGTLLHESPVTDADKIRYSNGISKQDAMELVKQHTVGIEAALHKAVTVSLNQNQFDALVDFCYNLGTQCLFSGHCTWVRNLNAGAYAEVPDGLRMWCKGNGVTQPGLVARRQLECDLWNKAV